MVMIGWLGGVVCVVLPFIFALEREWGFPVDAVSATFMLVLAPLSIATGTYVRVVREKTVVRSWIVHSVIFLNCVLLGYGVVFVIAIGTWLSSLGVAFVL
ncbi:MAG: hypothetical protein AAFY46_10945 [Planctomycetota bacterium]